MDCGMFQGGKKMELRNWREWDFDPSQISAVFLTHAHIDHSGRLPKLVRDGFKGRIITTAPYSPALRDHAAGLGPRAGDGGPAGRARGTGARPAKRSSRSTPRKTPRTASSTSILCKGDEIIKMEEGIRVRFKNAGHILGSSILEMWVSENSHEIKIVFSGDIGKANQLILKDPAEIFNADYLFVESTYGNRLHKPLEESEAELLAAIDYAYQKWREGHHPGLCRGAYPGDPLPLRVSSRGRASCPTSRSISTARWLSRPPRSSSGIRQDYDEEATAIVKNGIDPFSLPNLHYCETSAESMAINEQQGPGHRDCRKRHVHGRAHQAPPQAQSMAGRCEHCDRRIPGQRLHRQEDR
ncbi:MAG: MBL fold metallo-hydrolase [Desulfobacterales bacterium]|nr:MBL fold metallo-hydrolase [Desulfobacterales bacterium]